MNEKLASLRKFNLFMALLHFGQGVAMLWLSNSFKLPVMSSYLRFDLASKSLQPSPSVLFSLKIGPMIAIFLFLSALAHLLVGTIFNDWYNKNLARGINFARWVEYAFSSSIMIIVIAMLVGIYDISALILLFVLNTTMILFGWMMELHNQTLRESSPSSLSLRAHPSESKTGQAEKVNWTAFYFGCIAGLATWVVIALYLFGSGEPGHRAPNFVYWIYFSIFIFFNCFAINQVLQYKKVGGWRDYLYGERAYIILSLVAKSLLAWQVFAGTLRPV